MSLTKADQQEIAQPLLMWSTSLRPFLVSGHAGEEPSLVETQLHVPRFEAKGPVKDVAGGCLCQLRVLWERLEKSH